MIVCLPRRVNRFFAILVAAIVLSYPGCGVAPVTAQTVSPLAVEAQSLPDVLEKVTPAVVNIAVTSQAPDETNPLFNDPYFRRFFDMPQMPQQRPRMSAGSGVIVDAAKGYVLTNHHVVEGAGEIAVTLKDRRRFTAELVGSDKATDIALLRVDASNLTAMRLGDPSRLRVGDNVVAIGNPFGLGQTVTSGIVSALSRSGLNVEGYEDFIQTDASINPGNSGGALVDMTGKLVGINTAIFSRSGGSQGIGFAIPANMVRVVVASAERGGKAVKRPWLGARLQAVTPEIADTLGLARPTGALVVKVVPGSPAARGGLKLSDLIVGVDGQTVDDPNAFGYRFATRPIGGSTEVEVRRGGKAVKLAIPLEEAPDTNRNEIVITSRSPFQGARVANISPAVADELRLDNNDGVVITELADGGTAANGGFKKGDVILAVNGVTINDTEELQRVTRERNRLWRITVMRGGQQIQVTLGG